MESNSQYEFPKEVERKNKTSELTPPKLKKQKKKIKKSRLRSKFSQVAARLEESFETEIENYQAASVPKQPAPTTNSSKSATTQDWITGSHQKSLTRNTAVDSKTSASEPNLNFGLESIPKKKPYDGATSPTTVCNTSAAKTLLEEQQYQMFSVSCQPKTRKAGMTAKRKTRESGTIKDICQVLKLVHITADCYRVTPCNWHLVSKTYDTDVLSRL